LWRFVTGLGLLAMVSMYFDEPGLAMGAFHSHDTPFHMVGWRDAAVPQSFSLKGIVFRIMQFVS